jgi:hypothetical protein
MSPDTAPQPTEKIKRPKRRTAWPQLARQHGVSTRTLDRWGENGIIDPPEYINGRKYGDPDQPPRLDAKKRKAASHRDAESGRLLPTS